MIKDNQIIADFQKKILDWYAVHKRDLPWRKTQDPYKIWISESMLCQTQVARVIDYYYRWMESFPTVEDLACASNEQLLKAWSGLGYNSRALRLKQAAQEIVTGRRDEAVPRPKNVITQQNLNNGSNAGSDYKLFPNTYEELIKLPGVGDYIANAVLAFAYNQDVTVVDTNIRRIMIHEFASLAKGEKPKAKDHEINTSGAWLKDIVWQTLPKGQARIWYNALMDYGALELTSVKTGIKSLTKQSKFQGSTRQVRAGVLRAILHSQGGIVNYTDIQKLYVDRDDLDVIITKMEKDGLISVQDQMLFIRQ